MSKVKTKNSNIQRAKDFKGTLKMLLKRLSKHKSLVFLSIFFAVCSAVLVVLGPRVLNNLMQIIIPDSIGDSYELWEVSKYGLIILGMYVLGSILNYVQGYIMTKVSVVVSKNLRTEISQKINKLPLSYFDKNSFGDVLSRVTNDVDTVGNTLERTLSSLVTSLVMIIGIPIVMFTINWQLTLISLCQIPLALIIVLIVVKFNQKYFIRQQKFLGDINGYIEENYSAHNVVRNNETFKN